MTAAGTMVVDAALPTATIAAAPTRRALAGRRAALAHAALGRCRFCAHECAVNRRAGERGRCGAGATANVFAATTETGDELDLIPTFAIAFSGCDLHCAFCNTAAGSWNPEAGVPFSAPALAAAATTALARGARTVMFLGGEPTVHLPAALELVAALPDAARLVWKTNAHLSASARALLAGLIDVWLADFKFGNDWCARQLAGIGHYRRAVETTLRWARDDSDLIVRHLLVPGHVDCCWRPIAHWLARELPGVPVSLRSGFWPVADRPAPAELCGPVSRTEAARARAIGRASGLELIE